MLMYFVKKLRKLLAFAALCSAASALMALSLFRMISQARADSFASFEVLVYAAIWIGLLVFSAGSSSFLSRLSANAMYQVRTSLIRRILGTSYEKLERAGTPRLYNVLTNDVSVISTTYSEAPSFVYNLILVVSCLTYLAFLSPKMFMALSVAIALSFVVSKFLIKRLSQRSRAMRESQDAMMEGYKGMLDGSAQLAVDASRKAFYYTHDLQEKAARLREDERGYRLYGDINRAVTAALIFLLLGVLMEAGRRFGDHALVMSYALIITYCAGPFANVLNLLQLFAHARVSIDKIEALQIDPESDAGMAAPTPPAWNTIRFSQVEFKYARAEGEEPFVLGPIDVEIRKGEVLFITGGNGSGKSTFIKLLLGLNEPCAGTVYIDGVPQAWTDRAGYRALFSMVLSDFYLFRQVLDEHGRPADDALVQGLLERFRLDAVVKVRQGVFDTVRLSQGQKKRLALVAAIAQNKDIYVLDEWAADQDPHYRKVFYEEIVPWLRQSGKTVVAVTHDDRYFHVADQRVDFEAGQVRDTSARLGGERARPLAALSQALA